MSSCGVANWGGTKPGDPSNNSNLSATPAFGGIDLNWTYPTTNSHAVAYTRVYRAISPTFEHAMSIKEVGDTYYFDPVDADRAYFYWIVIVSVNGTVGEPIGPASATARPEIERMIELLTGQIDAGVLAQTLRNEINKIQLISGDLAKEIQDRIDSNIALSEFMGSLDANVGEVLSFVQEETTQRTEGDATLLEAVNTLAVGQDDTRVLITEERNLRIDADSALAESVALNYATKFGLTAAIQDVTTAYTSADQALASSVESLFARKSSLTTAIQDEATARVNGDGALSQRITTLESVDTGGQIAQAEQRLQTQINTVNGKVTSIGALYTVRLNVNGLIGGYGAYNDGTTVQMGFDVDSFWVGRTGANMRKPFIIDNGVTYIDDAAINKLTFSKLRSADGSVIVENGRMKANYIDTTGIVITGAGGGGLNVDTVSAGGRVTITNKGIAIYDAAGNLRGFFGDDS